jgi:hypothetical protein
VLVTQSQAEELAMEFGIELHSPLFREFWRGIAVELEHTRDLRIAAQIALDHLREAADYYTQLAYAEARVCDGKAQWVRLADVFFIGPLMAYGGVTMHRSGHGFFGPLLTILGVTTVIYNGYNYLQIEGRKPEVPQ